MESRRCPWARRRRGTLVTVRAEFEGARFGLAGRPEGFVGRWVAAPLPRAGGEVLRAAEGPGGAGALAGRREVGGIAPKAGTHHPPAEPMSAPPPPCGPSGGRFAAVPLGVALFPRTGRAGGPRGLVGAWGGGWRSAPPVCPGRLSGLAWLVLLFASQNVPMHFPGHE